MTEDYISELTRALGDIYAAVSDGVGSETRPGTSLFEVAQLESLAKNSLPTFGILDTTPASFEVTYDPSDPAFVLVSRGEVGFGTQRIAVPPQNIAIRRSFAAEYASDCVYGIRLGFPYREASRATQSYSTVTSSSTSAFATELPVENTSIPADLGFPVSAHVNNLFVRFSSVSEDGTKLVVDPAYDNGSSSDPSDPSRYGSIAVAIQAGTAVYFIYEPRVQAVYGLPVPHEGTNPSEFTYYPPLPQSWLPVANILVGPPSSPVVLTQSPGVYAIEQVAETFPIPGTGNTVFPAGDAEIIARASQSARAALRQARAYASVSEVIAGLEDYTSRKTTDAQVTFNAYWAAQPFRPMSFFARGVSFAGLERMEFSKDFVRAYYDMRGVDLQHTFAVFRGDLYDSPNTIYGSPPSEVSATSHLASGFTGDGADSTLGRGTYIYGVSAVTNSGETPVSYASAVASYSAKTYFVNHVEFSAVDDALFYHVYRRGNLTGDQTEYRLTEAEELTGYGSYDLPSVTFDSNRQIYRDYEAVQFVSSGTLMAAVQLRLYSYGTITNGSAYLTFSIYTDVAGVPGALVATLDTLAFSELTPQVRDFYIQGSAELTDGDTYWLVIGRSAAPSGGQVRLVIADDSVTGTYAYATTLGSWTTMDNITAYVRPMFGFLDSGEVGLEATRRGVRLTGRTSLTPRRIRVFVPPMADLDRGRVPLVELPGDNASVTASETETTLTMNEMIVTVTARNGAAGSPSTFAITVPKGTVRGTEFLVGTDTDLFDRVDDVQVRPGADLRVGSDNHIAWSIYDTLTVETVP